jgi:hypothetical protein
MGQAIDTRETAKTQGWYNRIAPVYDLMEISARAPASNGREAQKIGGEDG